MAYDENRISDQIDGGIHAKNESESKRGITIEEIKLLVESAHMAGQNDANDCDPSAYQALVYWEKVIKDQDIIKNLVNSHSI